jgi:hypothetical protein
MVGWGNELAGSIAPGRIAIPAAPVVLPAPGTTPAAPVPLPATMNAINALTHAQIIHLVCFYNEIFGIVAGDPIHVCITRFQEFMLDE